MRSQCAMGRRRPRSGLQGGAAIRRRAHPVLDALHGEADGFQLADARGREFHVALADGHELAAKIVVGCPETSELALLQLDAVAQMIPLMGETMDRRRSVEDGVLEVLVGR